MKIKSAVFESSADCLEGCPPPRLPELAFIGRSNVGKSSLINMLSGKRDQLAKVSSTPGKTRLINFFIINEQWRLVDLPGYGYAKVSKRQQSDFRDFVSDYLTGRPNLLGVFVLIDSRIPPQELDLEFISWLAASGIAFAIVFTKTDKLSASALQTVMGDFRTALAGRIEGLPDCLATSAKSGAGKQELLRYIGENLDLARKG